ncbi:MAG: DUF6049 family protein [Actinomycetota bacterium]
MSAAPDRQTAHPSTGGLRGNSLPQIGWVVVVVLITSLGSGALGQTPLDAPEARMELVEQPVWYEPGDELGISVEVFNLGTQPLEGFRIIVGVDDLIRTRSELDLFFDGVPRFEPSRIPIDLDASIEPGGSQVVSIDEPLEAIPTLGAAREAGVYPASLTLQDAEGTVDMDTVATPFIFYPDEPETPLGLVLAVPLNAAPLAAPDGSYSSVNDEGDLTSVLDPAEGPRAVVDALHEATGAGRAQPAGERSSRRSAGPDPLHVAVAPTPRLLSEISDLASGYRSGDERVAGDEAIPTLATEFLELLAEITTAGPAVQPLLVPYSFPDLPSLVASDLPIEHLAQQLSASRDVVATTLDLQLGGEWLYVPGGRLDAVTLEQLQLLGFANHSLFSHTSLVPLPEPSGCPSLSPTFTCPIEVELSEGVSNGFVSDPGLVERASSLEGDPLDRVATQRLLAETAMIHVELPGTTGRIIQLTIPASWNPSSDAARHLLLGLRDAPWLTSMTPAQALAEAEGELVSRSVDVEATPARDAPPEEFFEQLQSSTAIIDSYASILPAGNERIARLRRNLLVATSRNLWGDLDLAASYFRESRTEAEEAMQNISIELAQDFTLTSREGQVQLRVTNDTQGPVRLNIIFVSDGLEFEENETTEIFEPGSRLLELKTVARGSGVFRLDTRVETPEGGYLIDEKHTVIRSTSFNQIALAITIGALIFLVLFYLVRAARRRSHKKAVEA